VAKNNAAIVGRGKGCGMKLEEFDWNKVKVRRVGGTQQKPKHNKFVIVPLDWVETLARAKHASTLKLAHGLPDIEWRSPGQPIRLSNLTLKRLGVSRNQKTRGVEELQILGLVDVLESRPRQSPLVKLRRGLQHD
jgi:hypothetical protein